MSLQSFGIIEADKSKAPAIIKTLLIRGEGLHFIIFKQQTVTHIGI